MYNFQKERLLKNIVNDTNFLKDQTHQSKKINKKTKIYGGVAGTLFAGAAANDLRRATKSNFDKAKEAASTLKDVGKDAISNNSGKVGAIAGGTAAAIGGGLALKKYLKNRKKKI